jgi:uncharacterized membrane protein
MWAIGMVVGAFIGGAYDGAVGVLGAVAGLVLGFMAGAWKKRLLLRLNELEVRVAGLSQQTTAGAAAPAVAAAAPVTSANVAPTPLEVVPQPVVAQFAIAPETAPAVAAPLSVRKGGPGAGAPTAADVATALPEANAPPAAPRPAWLAWIMGGNTLARIGVLILFIGVGFLVKYATEHVRVPIEVRLAGVALGGIALLVLGWRLRLQRQGYAMILQGGGVGVLYLTVFGALRLYDLLPPTAAFALLFCIAAFSAWLAVRQDAIALAAVGVVGGFLAPILTSTNSGSHVLLFSYYALLNAGIFGIAWFKAWRSLNLLGFMFTFVIGTFWGVTRYRPEDFATTEPFLILFFLFYVAIAVLYALRQSFALRDYVDSTLVFGTPLFAIGLQSGMVHDKPYAMAFSAIWMSAVYLVLARILYARRSESVRLLVEAFLALGVIFATLAIPLALDARWTSASWALEGAAILWVGVQQRRRAVRAFGLLLQFGAGIAFASGLTIWHTGAPEKLWPILNSDYVGAALVGLAGLFSACLLQRRRADLTQSERTWSVLLLVWGTLWWLGAGWREIEHWLPRDARVSAGVALLAFSAIGFAVAARRLAWPAARVSALLLLPALLLITIESIARPWRAVTFWQADAHLFAHYGFLAWPVAVAVVVWLLRSADGDDAASGSGIALPLDLWHAGLLWLVTLLCAHELAWAGARVGSGEGVWAMVPWGLVPAVALGGVTMAAGGASWPIGARRHAYLIVGAAPIAIVLALWSLGANVNIDGDPAPLPYVPLFNPLDVTEALVLTALATWCLRLRRDGEAHAGILQPTLLAALFAALAFVWINGVALRTIHFWYDVPFTFHALWHSRLVQAVLALLWSLLALGTMVFANRRYWRIAWIAGATLLALVVAKLFLVDLSQAGGVERIVSFIGVGILLLLIGYLAPVPPRRPENAS